jgi:transcription termination factor Rho
LRRRRSRRDADEAPSGADDREPGQRTSNRFERQIADVEAQTGMRYFSSDELDFGDDDVTEDRGGRRSADGDEHDQGYNRQGDSRRGRGRGRGRFRRDRDRSPVGWDDRSENETHSVMDDSGSGDSWDDDSRDGGQGSSFDDRFDAEAGGHVDDGLGGEGDSQRGYQFGDGPDNGDRGPRRRRRRRRRGGSVQNGGGGPGRGDGSGGYPPNGSTDIDGRYQGRFDVNRQDGGRGRRGRNMQRGRRNEMPGRGPGSGRPMHGRGPDRGMQQRRGRSIQPSSFEVVEGTFEGVLELHPRGYGFLREPKKNYVAEDSNPFVSSSLVEKYKLREGVLIKGDVGAGSRNQGPRLQEVELIDGMTPEEYSSIKLFDTLTAINPFEQIRLEVGPRPITMRVMDLLCPIGKGQRALLVAPPRTGKTMLLQDIANSVSINHPEIYLMVLLIDERPEEVTEMRRNVRGEVISSSLDSDVESHVRISQLIIERAKRLAEEGKDVFILLDSITRMARAFNKWSNTGRTATGGLDIRALDVPKKLFGQARRFDEGGSLTVCGTALIDTGSKMDEAIFQEFKGTGNMEMVLSRDLADRRIWPSIDITKSGTRREEKILAPDMLEGITMLRRSLISLSPVEAMEQLTRTMEKFPTNREFLSRIKAVL